MHYELFTFLIIPSSLSKQDYTQISFSHYLIVKRITSLKVNTNIHNSSTGSYLLLRVFLVFQITRL